ncbi:MULTISPECIES: ATP-dependent DNA helicase [Oceanobacillus]|uniref:Exodeoxyribonuclease V n=1 Tax=Oceanobacillus kimchii TaxID=746691 RepID=A0ABQ5TSA1_9BACI|nr:AAA family ATPase [Oceanobacillus kimchii]GLO68365.1 exodeoxyribonuclease V [Oceanobacillus kimchii]
MKSIILTKEQEDAVKGIKEWFNKGERQHFVLAGFAGTGKTFLVDHLIQQMGLHNNHVAFAAFTGKASLLLRKANPGYRCSTIHRLAYKLDAESEHTAFILREKKELEHLRLIVIDEASMLSKEIFNDLLSFGIPLLLIGDEGQLPPIGGNFNVLYEPDFRLTEIHRQAKGNPIIHLSMLARGKKKIEPGAYGKNAYVLSKNNVSPQLLDNICLRSEQVLCGYNSTRKKINQKVRQLKGFNSPLPMVGDKLICTKNNWETTLGGISLVNGLTGFVKKVEIKEKQEDITRDCISVDFRPDFMSEEKCFEGLLLLEDDFKKSANTRLSTDEYKKYDKLDFGECITVHKAQGSAYERLLVINEVLDSSQHEKWLYTAITRSSDKLILVI